MEEEKRLFYVAMSRAKNHLFLTYPGKKHTHFITKDMLKLIKKSEIHIEPREYPKTSKTALRGDLSDRLREWRRSVSTNMDVPAFMIMHDRTLIALAQTRPTNEQELEEIHGMGPTKILKYGKELLDLINNQ